MPDIVMLTETWLSSDIYDNEIIPNNYHIYRNDRSGRGGGNLVAVHVNFKCEKINYTHDEDRVNVTGVKIK